VPYKRSVSVPESEPRHAAAYTAHHPKPVHRRSEGLGNEGGLFSVLNIRQALGAFVH